MTMPTDLSTQKKSLRAHMVEVRRRACADHGRQAAAALAALAGQLGAGAGDVVAAYSPMGDELDPRPLLERLQGMGCRLALPVVTARGQPLDFRAWATGDALEPGLHGTTHPLAGAAPAMPDVLLVPLLAFDRQCFRLGYGGGYYDRTLESLRRHAQVRAIGIGFAAQQVEAVPRDGHDQRLDAIATEQGLIA
jgi:5-formyltetrahydrofolate cyclo-ligase